MTKEEAIKTLCTINVPEGHTTIIDKEANIALDMAIQALSVSLPEGVEEAAENYIAPIENDEGLDYINFNGRDIKDAFIAGAEWDRAKMLEGAEECELYYDGDFLAIDLNMEALGYSEKDKVKVIVIKEDEK